MVNVSSARKASAIVSAGISLITSIGALTPARRNSIPSSTRATASESAPPWTAAWAAQIAPCPYPLAFTTAQISASPTTARSDRTLCSIAETETSAHAGR